VLRRVSALVVFCSSFLVHKMRYSVDVSGSKRHRLCRNLKGKQMFSVIAYTRRETVCRLASSNPFQLPFIFYCDLAKARSYFASTVTIVTIVGVA
jgi:hypothetical protein